MFMRFIVLALSLIIGCSTHAKSPQHKTIRDHRLRSMLYNPEQVVQLNTVVGRVIHIILEEGEVYLTHAFGDAEAYTFVVEHHHLFLKPKAEDADTNLVVVTDRRSYNFCLKFQPHAQKASIYQIKFIYPETEARRRQQEVEKNALHHSFEYPSGPCNLNYTMSGDQDIAPTHVWDDGRFSYFKFAPHHDLPAIYMQDAGGAESMVNQHITGHDHTIVVLHKIHDHWVLRLGERALAIHNEAQNPLVAHQASRTTSSTVKRLIKDHF